MVMRFLLLVLLPLCCCCLPAAAGLRFEPNLGQADPATRFVARTPGGGLALLHDSGFTLAAPAASGKLEIARLGLEFAGGAATSVTAGDRSSTPPTRYFLGSNPQARSVPSYTRVRYRAVWPGIDALVYGNDGGQLEYDFIVAPGADPAQIALLPAGASNGWRLDRPNGDLILETPDGAARMVHRRPRVYQGDAAIEGRFVIGEDRAARFALGEYDRLKPLVIDPVVSFSSYLGGSGGDIALGVTADDRGFIYICGYTVSSNYPAVNSLPRPTPNAGFWDAVITKINPHTRSIVYSAVIGGRANDLAAGVAVDGEGNAYIAGTTNSDNFPVTERALQRSYAGGHSESDTVVLGDAFVTKLDPAGARLVYSTYLGAPLREYTFGVKVDTAGSAYVFGNTDSPSFPTRSAAQPNYAGGSTDGFLTKLAPDGASIVLSTFLGGNQGEDLNSLTLDSAGNLYAAGATLSANFPWTPRVVQTGSTGGSDGFLVKMSPAGAILFSTYLGTRGADHLSGVAVAGDGSIYVSGYTSSENFPVTSDAAQKTYGGGSRDVVVARLAADGTRLLYATYLGAEGSDGEPSIGLDGNGRPMVVFDTSSKNLPVTADALQRRNGGVNNFAIARFTQSLSAFEYLTYWGSGGSDNLGYAAFFDRFGNIYLAGNSDALTYPKVRTVQEPAGDFDMVVSKAVFGVPRLETGTSFVGIPADSSPGQAVLLPVTSQTGPMPYTVTVPANAASWLAVEPLNGIAPADPVRLSARAGASLAPGRYSTMLALASPEFPGVSAQVEVELNVRASGGGGGGTPPPAPRIGSVVHGASFRSGPVSPGLIVTLFGERIGPDRAATARLDAAGRVATELAGTRVLFDETPAPILFTSATQTTVIVPYSVSSRSSVNVIVEFGSARSPSVAAAVAQSAPGIFTANSAGTGPGSILNQDGTLNTSGNPAVRGSIVSIYLTGEGRTDPPGIDGQPAAGANLPTPALPVNVQIGGMDAEILYAGAAPGYVAGAMQINARIPTRTTTGAIPVVVQIGLTESQPGVTLAVR